MADITSNRSFFSEALNFTNNSYLIDQETTKDIIFLTEQHIMYKIGESISMLKSIF